MIILLGLDGIVVWDYTVQEYLRVMLATRGRLSWRSVRVWNEPCWSGFRKEEAKSRPFRAYSVNVRLDMPGMSLSPFALY